MVSSGTVSSDSSSLGQVASKYMEPIEGLSSSWKGSSYDNLANQASKFSSDVSHVTSQMSSFAKAVSLYEKYKEVKDRYNSYVNTYNNQVRYSNDSSAINQYRNSIAECERLLKEYSSQIQAALSEAASYKLEATSLTASATASLAAGSSATTISQSGASTGASSTVSTNGGQFVADRSRGVYGHFTSSMDGKTHTIFNQSQIDGWGSKCNRAAAASIASAYASDDVAVSTAKKSAGGLGSSSKATNDYFSQFGLSASVNKVDASYDSVKDSLVSNLKNGNYVMFDLSQSNVYGKSGQKWTSKRHWVSILDIKKTGNGSNDYAIFVSDSGHGGSAADHGLGAGWYSVDEFSGKQVENFTVVSPARTV